MNAADLAVIKAAALRRGDPLRGVPADPGAHRRVGAVTRPLPAPAGRHRGRRRLARQPRPGGVRRGAQGRRDRRDDRRAAARRSASPPTTSRSTRGLIARAAALPRAYAPHAELEVRMDSRLVVEQMSGSWKIKHPDMKPLALEANRLAPFGTTFTWVPREQNKHADRLANEALDGLRDGVRSRARQAPTTGPRASRTRRPRALRRRYRGWSSGGGTAHHVRAGAPRRHRPHDRQALLRRPGQRQPGLNDEGRAQVRATAEWLAPLAERPRRGRQLTGPPHPRVRRDPGRGARLRGGRRGGAGRDGVRRLGRPHLHRGARQVPGRGARLARQPRPRAGRSASRSARSRSGCWPAATGCSRSTTAGPCSWSAT